MDTNSKSHKKSEVLEIRLPHDDKQAFMKACKQKDVTASAVLRAAVNVYLKRGHFEANLFNRRSFMMMFSSMIIGGSLVAGVLINDESVKEFSSPLIVPYFQMLDSDDNGRLSMSEFLSHVSGVYAAKRYPAPYSFSEVWFQIEGDIRQGWSKDAQTNQAMRLRLHECDAVLTQITQAHMDNKFKALDIDEDGDLTLQEFKELQLLPTQYDLQREFVFLDGNGDGGIDIREIRQALGALNQDRHDHNTLDFSQEMLSPQACTSAGVKTNDQSKMVMSIGKWAFSHQRFYWSGISDAYFVNWDKNNDELLSFQEFITWYL